MGDSGVCLYGDGSDLEARRELDEAGKIADSGIRWIPPRAKS